MRFFNFNLCYNLLIKVKGGVSNKKKFLSLFFILIISLSIGLIFIDINHFFQIRRKVNTNDINLELVSKLKEKNRRG